jgi:hypothetical protein
LAVRVDNLYGASAPLEGGSRNLPRAFDAALATVLVKVTGRRDIDPAITGRFGDASRFVQQYRIDADQQVWVNFDAVAVRRELDAVGASVWGAERPTTLVWLIVDDGSGYRAVVGAAEEQPGAPGSMSDPDPQQLAAVREELQDAADRRGLPLLLPLVDTEDISSLSLSDVWGGFTESVTAASARYGPDAVLVGRGRAAAFGPLAVRWTLLVGAERYNWEGDLASGPNDVADFFAARLSASASSSGTIVLSVDAVDSFAAYGRLSAYLGELDLVEGMAVDHVSGDRVVFRLEVRGDADRLMRSIALQRVLQPVDGAGAGPLAGVPGGPRALHYRLIPGP